MEKQDTVERVRKVLEGKGLLESVKPEILERFLADVASRAIPLLRQGAGHLDDAILLAVQEIEQGARAGRGEHKSGFARKVV